MRSPAALTLLGNDLKLAAVSIDTEAQKKPPEGGMI